MTELLESLVDSLGTPLVGVDRERRIVVVNDAAENLFGRSRAKLAGRSLDAIEPLGPSLARLARQALDEGARTSAFVEHAGLVEATPWWSGAELVGALVVAHAPHATGAPTRETDIATLAAGLAHEVRNPLAALRGAAELMKADLDRGAAIEPEYVALILREAARVDALVGRMLDLSRPPKLALAKVPIAELVHDLALQAKALARSRGAELRVVERFDPALPPLVADRARLFEALVNLAKNAVEAAQGEVLLSASVDPELRRREPSGRTRPLARLAIRDDGPGLGRTREQLFTPFFTTKAGGTGLGLVLARAAIEAHGGRLTLDDAGRGAEATVLLPLGETDG